MRGKTHLLVGVAAGAAAAISVPADNHAISAGVFIATTIGSLYPDIDNSQSMLGRKIKPISFIINKLFGHRGFIHTPFNLICLLLLMGTPLILTEQYNYLPIVIGFAVGFLSHLFLDAITKGGISFLYPFSRKRFNLTTIKTGGIGENLIVVFMLLISGGVIATTFLLR